MGATGMGRQGAKYRVRSKGQNSAIPRPPSVRVSSSPWLTSATVPSSQSRRERVSRPSTAPSARAKGSACVAPRCPQGSP